MPKPSLVAGAVITRFVPEFTRVFADKFDVRLVDFSDPVEVSRTFGSSGIDFLLAMPDYYIIRYLSVQVDLISRRGSIDHLVTWIGDDPDLPEVALSTLGVCACLNFARPIEDLATELLSIGSNCLGNRHGEKTDRQVSTPNGFFPLSALDERIMQMISIGFRDKEISDSLHYAPQTIRNRVVNLMTRFEASNRTQLTIKWRRLFYQTRIASDRSD